MFDAIQLIIQMCTSLLRWRLNPALQVSQASAKNKLAQFFSDTVYMPIFEGTSLGMGRQTKEELTTALFGDFGG